MVYKIKRGTGKEMQMKARYFSVIAATNILLKKKKLKPDFSKFLHVKN